MHVVGRSIRITRSFVIVTSSGGTRKKNYRIERNILWFRKKQSVYNYGFVWVTLLVARKRPFVLRTTIERVQQAMTSRKIRRDL